MNKAPPSPSGPRWRDHLNREAGRWAKATGARKNSAKAQGHTPQRESQIRGGDPTGAPQRFYVLIDGLARTRKTCPYPLIAGAHVTAQDAFASEHDSQELERALRDAIARRIEANAQVDVQLSRYLTRGRVSNLTAILDAGESAAYATLRLLGVGRVLVRREGE